MNLYDEGYKECPCYWGKEPATFVKEAVRLLKNRESAKHPLKAIDLGCGEGKNSAYVSKNNISIIGLDQSEFAISHAYKLYPDLASIFLIGDMQKIEAPDESFDLVISTGSVHCLTHKDEVTAMISKMKRFVKKSGLIAFSSFNDRQNDFSGHPESFNPILLSHEFFVKEFTGLKILHESDKDLHDIHPDNNIEHFHSITRILATKL